MAMRRLRTLLRRNRLDEQLEKELTFHLDQRVDDLIATGLSRAQAVRRARLDLGGLDQIKEQVRDGRPGASLDALFQDARSGLRALRRTPGVAIAAITLIALVVGGNTTIFSMVHGLLTKPAPSVQADRLVTLELRINGRPAGPGNSYPDYLDYVAQSKTVRPLLGGIFERFAVTVESGSYALRGLRVSSNYFDTLGVRLARGRTFTDADNRLDASGLVAVVSHRLWQEQLHGAEDVIGRSIVVNGHPATIVGVAPPEYHGAMLAESGDIWVPLLAYSRVDGKERGLHDRTIPFVIMIGQLASGVSLSQAQAELSAISTRLQAAYPQTNRDRSVAPVPYSMIAAGDSLVARQIPVFMAIFSIVAILTVLIVCANVANLMLARAVVRQRELAVRQSLGASRVRIVRMLVAEGLVISLTAWAAACLFALWVSKTVPRMIQSGQGVTLNLDFTPDWRVAAYAMVLAVLCTVAFTIAPALQAWKQELLPWLKAGEHGVVQGRSRLSRELVIVQLAFSVLLLTSTGLAYRSLGLIGAVDLGFNKDNLLLVRVNTAGSTATREANVALLDRLRERLRSIAGVGSVSYAGSAPAGGWQTEAVRGSASQQPVLAERNDVGPDYLHVLGITPILGRELAEREGTLGNKTAVINQGLAEALWPGQSAIGRTMLLGARHQTVEVVGVTPNGFFSGFRRETRPNFVFLSAQQEPLAREEGILYVRYDGRPDTIATIAPAIGPALRQVDPRISVVWTRSMTTQLDDILQPVRLVTILLTLFSVGSLAIAAIGQYAVIGFDMRRRTRDLGVRMTLGASSQQIVGSVLGEGFRLTAAGLGIGFALSLAAGRALGGFLYGVTPTDTPTYLGVAGLLAAASLVACYLPARRASRIDPMQALRQE